MTIKEQIANDWNTANSLRYPSSLKQINTEEHHLLLADSFADGCISSYLHLNTGEPLDNDRLKILQGCRIAFVKAQPFVTDEDGKTYLALYLRMSTMVLVDCGVLNADELANLPPTP